MKIMMMLGLLFVWSIQPYLMIVSLMILTIGYSVYIYYGVGSYWYSYMLVLVMLSGILVLFTYISSLIPNESFEYISLIYASLFIYLMMLFSFKYNIFYFNDISIIMLKMWEMYISFYNFYMVLFLLMIMVMVVWVSNFDFGAVRNF